MPNDFNNLFLSDKLWQVQFGGAMAEFIYYWTRTDISLPDRSRVRWCKRQHAEPCNGGFPDIAIALPEMDQQAAIVRFLSDRTDKIDQLMGKSIEVIGALKEYRVGPYHRDGDRQIDVRKAVA